MTQFSPLTIPDDAVRLADRTDRTRLLDATLNALIAVDANGRCLHWNLRAGTMFGLEAGDAPGCVLAGRVVAPGSRRRFDRLIATAARSGTASAAALDAVDAGGRLFPVEIFVTRFVDDDGPWFAVCVRDMTQERLAQTQLDQRARVAVLAADVGLALTRPGPLLVALDACMTSVVEHLGGLAAGVWLLDDRTDDEAADGAGRDPVLRLVAHAERDGSPNICAAELTLAETVVGQVAADQAPFLSNAHVERGVPEVVAFAGHPLVVDETLFGVVAVYAARELTTVDDDSLRAVARKLSLAIARQRGIDALRLRAAELARSARALERSNRDLDQFAYIASHDLKAPLRGIANLATWIEEDLGDRVPDSVREHLGLLRGRVDRMEKMIEGILEYSRAGRIATDAEELDTGALVRDVISLLSPPAAVRFDISPELPVVRAARLPLQQVFQNLLGNAVKYARHDAPVVSVTAAWVPEGVRFSIRDNGPGIAPVYHARIWGVFQRLEARDKVEGTGIGLALVKKIVDSVGGSVGLDSEVGQGATFYFTWPAHPCPPKEA